MKSSILQTQWVYRSVFKLISPIIRVLLGVLTYPQFCEILKLAYFREAENFIKKNSIRGKITKSELTLLTGVDSRQFPEDVNFDLLSENRVILDMDPKSGQMLYPETYILGIWDTQQNYLTDSHKKSKTIPIYGRQHSFESYVRKHYTRGVTIQSVLGRLIASNNIEMIDTDYVSLKSPYYIPIDGEYEQLLKIGLNHIKFLSNTVAHNLLEEKDSKFFERCYRTNNLKRQDFTVPCKSISNLFTEQIKESEKIILDFENGEQGLGKNYCGVGYFYFELTDGEP